MRRILLLVVGLSLVGCGSVHSHKVVSPKVVVKPSNRCRTVGKKIGKYATVLVRKDCLVKGKTEVTILLHAVKFAVNNRKMFVAKLGVEESLHIMVNILGFKPKLAAMAVSRVKGIPCYVFLVTGTDLD